MVKITISGLPGAGKTTIAKMLAKELGLEFIPHSFAREISKEKKITINELMEKAKTDKSIHKEIDKRIINCGKNKDNFVLASWISYYFIPDSIKIFLYVSPKKGAKRIYKNQRKEEIKYVSLRDTLEKTRKRILDSKKGFKNAYGINFLLRKNYDIIIDTSNKSKKRVLKSILRELKNLLPPIKK